MKPLFETTMGRQKSEENGAKLRLAVKNRDALLVTLWMNEPSVTANSKGQALQDACDFGYDEIVKILLKDKDITKNYKNSAFKIAIKKEHHTIINFMIVDFDITDENKLLALSKCNKKEPQIQEPENKQPSKLSISAEIEPQKTQVVDDFLATICTNDEDTMKPFLSNPKISVAFKALALYEAICENRANIVKLLLKDDYLSNGEIIFANYMPYLYDNYILYELFQTRLFGPPIDKSSTINHETEFLSAVKGANTAAVTRLLKNAIISDACKDEALNLAFKSISNLRKEKNTSKLFATLELQIACLNDIIDLINQSSNPSSQNSLEIFHSIESGKLSSI